MALAYGVLMANAGYGFLRTAPYCIGITVTALLHLWKHNSLLSIAGGTAVYMVLVQSVFRLG